MARLSYKRLAQGASIRSFALPLGSLVSPGSPSFPASLGKDTLPPRLASALSPQLANVHLVRCLRLFHLTPSSPRFPPCSLISSLFL